MKRGRSVARRASAEVRRAALIEATLVCLRKYGQEGISVRRICAEAGVSAGLLNHYYPSKSMLVAAAYRQLSMTLLHTYGTSAKFESWTPRERLRRYFEAWFAPEAIGPDMLNVWLVFWRTASTDRAMREAYDEMYRAYRMHLETLLEAVRTSTAGVAFDLRTAAIVLSGMLDGLWLQMTLNPRAFEIAEALDACDQWIDGLCAQGLRS